MKDLFVKAKIVFDRGKQWIGYFNFLMIVFITVASMKAYTTFSFLSSTYWLIIIIIASFLLIALIGWLEVKKFGTYQKEAEILGRINPTFKRIFENQEKIMRDLKELKKKVKD
jgi:hypothetical protein